MYLDGEARVAGRHVPSRSTIWCVHGCAYVVAGLDTHIVAVDTHCVCVSCCVSFGIVRCAETRHERGRPIGWSFLCWVFGVNSCELNVALTTRGRRSLPHVHNKHRRFLSLSFTLYVSMLSAPGQAHSVDASTEQRLARPSSARRLSVSQHLYATMAPSPWSSASAARKIGSPEFLILS